MNVRFKLHQIRTHECAALDQVESSAGHSSEDVIGHRCLGGGQGFVMEVRIQNESDFFLEVSLSFFLSIKTVLAYIMFYHVFLDTVFPSPWNFSAV